MQMKVPVCLLLPTFQPRHCFGRYLEQQKVQKYISLFHQMAQGADQLKKGHL